MPNRIVPFDHPHSEGELEANLEALASLSTVLNGDATRDEHNAMINICRGLLHLYHNHWMGYNHFHPEPGREE